VIIAVSGFAQTGKDLIGSILVERGFKRLAFADVLRSCLYAFDPLVISNFGYTSVRTLVDCVGWEEAKAHQPESPWSIRRYLQRLGTEVGREILGYDTWVRAAVEQMEPGVSYVITDPRFKNEADFVRENGGLVIRVNRPGYGPINDHPSETELVDYPFDMTFENDGTIDDLRGKVMEYLATEVAPRMNAAASNGSPTALSRLSAHT
jgi:hypothetical protein